jgi:parallel beta-helix repeat protein
MKPMEHIMTPIVSPLRRLAWLACIVTLVWAQARLGQRAASASGYVVPADNLIIMDNTTLQPGTYTLTDTGDNEIVLIGTDNITLDGNGAVIDGGTFTGYGIDLNGHTGVTIQNLTVRGYAYGMRIRNASGVTIRSTNVSGNRKDITTWFLNINAGTAADQETYGGGIFFENVTSSTVSNNTLTNQSTGLEMVNSHRNTVKSNLISSGPVGNESQQNSCWGIRLKASTNNLLEANTADYVDRERYPDPNQPLNHLPSGDSAGILLVGASHNNRIISNALTHGGDGFFIGNEHGAPSNNNYIYGNDGSFSPHNAFEATFSTGNIFERNTASSSHYGFWLGFSSTTQVVNNDINDNRAEGIAIDSGHDNTIKGNRLQRNQAAAVHLWDSDTTASRDTTIDQNTINNNATGLLIESTDTLAVTRNQIQGNTVAGARINPTSANVTITQNNLIRDTVNQPENLARGKPATASKMADQASRAVDGDTLGGDSSSWYPGTVGLGDYWQVDLGAAAPIAGVALFPFSVNYHDFPQKFYVEVSSTGAFAGEQVRVVTEDNRVEQQVSRYVFPAVTGRYIRVVMNENRNWVRLSEFVAFSQSEYVPGQSRTAIVTAQTTPPIQASHNWWGTSNAADIAGSIQGGGTVVYSPFLIEPHVELWQLFIPRWAISP